MPRGIQAVRKGAKTYYYYAPGRGRKDHAVERVPLGTDTTDPLFWQTLRKAQGQIGDHRPQTFGALIAAYRSSAEFERLRPASKRDYGGYLDRIEEQAGDRLVADLSMMDVYALRDGMKAAPVAANHMLSILRTLIKWGIPRGYRGDNPVIGVERLIVEDNGARPWPEDGYQFVMQHAPELLRRMTYLGRATGQRAGDLVRMRPCDLAHDGIAVRIGKRREIEHFVPLTAAHMAEIRSWGVMDLDFFLRAAKPETILTAANLNSKWNDWRKVPAAKPIRHLKMTIHGLRATAVVDRQSMGTADNGIADEIGMSVGMVRRYSRFADKSAKARASRDRRERGTNKNENFVVTLKTGGG